MKIKRLHLDIETSEAVARTFRIGREIELTYKQIIQEAQIIMISYKWEGSRVKNISWIPPKDLQDYTFGRADRDRHIIKEIAKIIREADEIVGHNLDRFDWRWINGRALLFGIDMPQEVITVDTLKIARKHFRLSSNRLDYLAQILGVGGKTDTGGLELWHNVENGDKKALSKMIRYCNNDVVILEKVFNKLKPYIKNKITLSKDRVRCAECNIPMVRQRERMLVSGAKKVVLKCNKCGKYKSIPLSSFK